MALASSGTLSINDIAGEFGGSSNPESLSEFYRGGSRVPNSPANSSIPTSGTIAISNFYNGSASSDIITGTGISTTQGGGKNITFFYGIRPCPITNGRWIYVATGTPQFQFISNSNTACGGSWSDDYAETSGVTIDSYYVTTGSLNFGTANFRAPQNGNLTPLQGKTCSRTAFFGTNTTASTTTQTQAGTTSDFAAGVSPTNQYINTAPTLIGITNNTTITVSWT